MRYYVLDINPEPWAIGDVSVGKRNGKYIPIVGQNQQLKFYKEGIASLLRDQDAKMLDGAVRLEFYFWRRLDSSTANGRKTRASKPDVTNMQKATEDGCQGVLFENDRSVSDIRSVLVQASPDVRGCVVVGIEGDSGLNLLDKLGEVAMSRIRHLNENKATESNNAWIDEDDEPF